MVGAPWEILDQPNVPHIWPLPPICENYFQGVERRLFVETEESKSFQMPDNLTKNVVSIKSLSFCEIVTVRLFIAHPVTRRCVLLTQV